MSNFFAFEEQERDEMGEEVHLGAGSNRRHELGKGLAVAGHSFVEVLTSDSSIDLLDCLLDELLRYCLHDIFNINFIVHRSIISHYANKIAEKC